MSGVEVELDRLRIPSEKIKFGKRIESSGYGSVSEGLLDDRPVALKQINITNVGDIKTRILSEILLISKFRHPNLVTLLGFCDEKSSEIVLVYEYVSSGSLADKMRMHLTTIQRLEICLGAARGLECLHTGIIHGDVKPSKILLNEDSTLSKFEAKVSNFGLSKVRPGHVLERADPTPAYRDPEFEVTGKLTKESDVYSLGVVLLEVLCGVPEIVDTDDYQEKHVTELVPKRLEQKNLRKIVHRDIRNEIKSEALETYAKIACQCVMRNPEDRPPMARVVEELEEALRLQGGQVTYVPILGSENGVDIAEDGKKEDENGVSVMGEDSIEEGKIEDGNGMIVDLEDEKKEDENGVILNMEDEKEEDGTGVVMEYLNEAEKEREAIITNGDEKVDDLNITTIENKEDEKPRNTSTSPESTNGEDSGITPDHPTEEKSAAEDSTVQVQSSRIPNSGSENGNGDSIPNGCHAEDDQKEDGDAMMTHTNDPEKEPEAIMMQENTDDLNNTNFIGDVKENESKNASSESINQEKATRDTAMLGQGSNFPESGSTDGSNLLSSNNQAEDAQRENADSTAMDSNDTEKKPESIIMVTERSSDDFYFASNDKLKPIGKTQEKESKRSGGSTSSESSYGDNSAPSDYLIQHKSPAHDATVEKRDYSGNCCSCFASWGHFFSNRPVSFVELFWNKLASLFMWIKGLLIHKRD